jgi:hypothetical protein
LVSPRARELDVVGAQHLEHLGPHQPHDQRELEQRQRDRRQDQVLPALCGQQPGRPPAERDRVAAAVRRQHAELNREHEDQQDPDQEGRQRDADQRRGEQELRQPRVPLQRRIHAHRNAGDDRDDRGGEGQFERGGQPLLDQRRHRAPLPQADAEVALHRVDDEVAELHEKGLIEPQVGAQPRAVLGCGILAEHLRHRIADVLEQQEGDERDRQHHEDRLQQSADDEGQHVYMRMGYMQNARHCRAVAGRKYTRKGRKGRHSGPRARPPVAKAHWARPAAAPREDGRGAQRPAPRASLLAQAPGSDNRR